MSRPLYRKVVMQGAEALGLDTAALTALVQRWGRVQSVDALDAGGYHRLVDILLLEGFRTRHRPVLSAETRIMVEKAYTDLGLSLHALETDLRRQGIRDLRDLDGQGLLDLMSAMEVRGVDLARFKAERRTIKRGQLRTLGIMRKAVGISDFNYYRLIQRYGGVNTAADFDARGYAFTVLCLESLGYSRPEFVVDAGLGDRPGFASPRQVALIRALWTEGADDGSERALNVWLERYHRVSAVRFLTSAMASKAITALRAMKCRKAAAARVTA